MLAEAAWPKELESTAVIRFQDCDPFRHLNNARYVDYFMNAREDQLKQFYNFNIFDVAQETNHGWVVSKTQIAYLFPAMMQESILVRTQLIQMTGNVLVVEGVMLDADATRPKAVSWIEFTFVNLATGRPANHPVEFMDRFASVVVEEVFMPDGFNQRVAAIKADFRARAKVEKVSA